MTSNVTSSDSPTWTEFQCIGLPCNSGNPPPSWPDSGVQADDGGACPPLGSACSAEATKCGRSTDLRCGPAEICAGASFNFYGDGPGQCPISRRSRKQDVHYLGDAERESVADEALSIHLATYRYKPEAGDPAATHLGFIIDDDPTSPAVTADGQHVDVYGYVSMAIATLQEQSREIRELRAEVEQLSAEVKERRPEARPRGLPGE